MENIITMLKLSLNIDLNLFWFKKKDDQNFCVSIYSSTGFSCNTIIVDCLNGNTILHINLFVTDLIDQHLKYDISNIEDINNLINKYFQDITYTYKNLSNL